MVRICDGDCSLKFVVFYFFIVVLYSLYTVVYTLYTVCWKLGYLFTLKGGSNF